MTTTPPAAATNHDGATRPLLISIAQAAAMLSVSRSSIYQLIWNEQLTPIRIGHSVRVPIEHIEEFIADQIDQGHR